MNLYEAIRNRRSVRFYKNIQVSQELLHGLLMYAGRIMPLADNIKTEFVFLNTGEKEEKIKGMFQVHSPHVLVLYSEEKPGWAENAGYMMEQMVLYMAAKGIGSCYMGAAKAELSEKEGMRQAVLLAFGYAGKALYREQGQVKRQGLAKLCVYPEGKNISPDIAAILQAARLAPSSFNSQPWRFVVCHDRIHVFVCHSRIGLPESARLSGINMGIVLSHIMLAAEEQWVTADIKKEDGLSEKVYKKGKYLCTVILK